MKDGRPPEEPVWQRDEIDSPCVKLCVLHPGENLCIGCLRTPGEIAAWSRITGAERRAIMATLKTRAPRIARRRGGRAARLERE